MSSMRFRELKIRNFPVSDDNSRSMACNLDEPESKMSLVGSGEDCRTNGWRQIEDSAGPIDRVPRRRSPSEQHSRTLRYNIFSSFENLIGKIHSSSARS